MDKIKERIKILYGSETGNAQDFAEQIHKKCRTNSVLSECLAIDDYPIQVDHFIFILIKIKRVSRICSKKELPSLLYRPVVKVKCLQIWGKIGYFYYQRNCLKKVGSQMWVKQSQI